MSKTSDDTNRAQVQVPNTKEEHHEHALAPSHLPSLAGILQTREDKNTLVAVPYAKSGIRKQGTKTRRVESDERGSNNRRGNPIYGKETRAPKLAYLHTRKLHTRAHQPKHADCVARCKNRQRNKTKPGLKAQRTRKYTHETATREREGGQRASKTSGQHTHDTQVLTHSRTHQSTLTHYKQHTVFTLSAPRLPPTAIPKNGAVLTKSTASFLRSG